MNFLTGSPYTKTTTISLLLHGTLIGLLILLGVFTPAAKPQEIAPIQVDIVPAKVISMGNITPAAAAPPPPVPEHRAERPVTPKTQPVKQQPAPVEPLPPAIPGETSDTAVAKAVSPAAGPAETPAADSGGGQTQPNCLYRPDPIYPEDAIDAGWEGEVLLRVLVDTDGSAASVAVRISSGYDTLDNSAMDAVRKWRFSPAKKAGVPVPSFYDVRVHFSLVDAG